MASPLLPAPSPIVRFPRFSISGDLNSLSIVVQDLSVIYDFTAVAVLPGYEEVLLPGTRIGPRRWSPLAQQDQLKVKRISLASPLEIVFAVGVLSTMIGGVAIAINRVLLVAKTWVDILAAGVDREQREQALEEGRALAAEHLREAQLMNALREQRLRRATAEAELVEGVRDEILHRGPVLGDESILSASGELTSRRIAELLDDPVYRLLSFSGGELEVAGDEPESS
jgi:hypothetical protein